VIGDLTILDPAGEPSLEAPRGAGRNRQGHPSLACSLKRSTSW
jgi:hypothetical protein